MMRLKLRAIPIAVFLWLLAMVLVKFDSSFHWRWLVLSLHFASLSIIFLSPFYLKRKEPRSRVPLPRREHYLLLIILLLALVSRLLFLESYPFVAVGDEVRDGGLNARQIYEGSLKNIFGYGRYDAHGLVIPTLVSFLYPILGNSVLTYRLPAALISFLDVLLIAIVGYRLVGRRVGFWPALILATAPLHLYYGRTEVVVIFSSFLTSLILLVLFFYTKNFSAYSLLVLSTLLGFSSGFHASVKAVALLSGGLVLLNEILCWVRQKTGFQSFWQRLFLFGLFFLVGFGPRLYFSPWQVFFHTSRFAFRQSTTPLIEKSSVLAGNYFNSLMVWFYKPTTSWYPDKKPLLPPLLAIFLVLGLLTSLGQRRKLYQKMLLFLFFLIPLTNSAITDGVNNDHRILPLLPIGAILIAQGINFVETKLKRRSLIWGLSLVLLVSSLLPAANFFFKEKANRDRQLLDYLSMHLVYFLRSRPDLVQKSLCLAVSPRVYTNLSYLHYQEQYQYFLPNFNYHLQRSPVLDDNEVFLGKKCGETTDEVFIINCRQPKPLFCPPKFNGEIKINY